MVSLLQGVGGNGYPTVLDSLIGKRMLFKVETKVNESVHFGGTFPVRRICLDEDIIAMFELSGADLTPIKVDCYLIFVPPLGHCFGS